MISQAVYHSSSQILWCYRPKVDNSHTLCTIVEQVSFTIAHNSKTYKKTEKKEEEACLHLLTFAVIGMFGLWTEAKCGF